MRLTLRTMLAYLDDVLEPADAQELGQKIEESEFATGLVQRIRSSTRRLRLGAPKLEGKGVGQDANSVAEYLDNTLSPDQVPEFEKVCLESEAHLAEVTACHQVLTLVLGEPADVEPATRERIYRLTGESRTEPAAAGVDQPAATPVPAPKSDMSAAATATAETTPAEDEATSKSRKKPEVPDYLKSDSKLRLWPMVITLLLALLLAGAALMAVWPETVTKWFAGNSDEVTTTADASADVEPTPDPLQDAPDAVAPDTGPVAVTPGPDTDTVAGPAGPVQPDGVLPTGPATRIDAPPAPIGGDADAIVETPTPGVDPTQGADPDGGVVPPIPRDETGLPTESDSAETPPAGVGPFEMARVEPEEKPPIDESVAEPAPPPSDVAQNVGRFISDEEILIRQDRQSSNWHQIPSRNPLNSGDRLIALPTFRPQMSLIGDVQMTLDGGTAAGLAAPDSAGVPWVNVEYGRVVLITIGKAGAQVGLQIGSLRGLVTFGDADTTIALEVQPFQEPGTDPESGDPHMLSKLFATSGALVWEPVEGPPVRIEAGRVRRFIDTGWAETIDMGESPKWIASKDLTDIDRQAAEVLFDKLPADSEISLRLDELTEHRRPEVKALAIRCGGYLDQYEPFVATLDDPGQKSYWRGLVGGLVEAIQRGPATAALVRKALEKHRNADAKNLYRLLWGFSEDDLKNGWDARLVEYLESDAMEYRVLAIENLRQINGGKTLVYRADLDADRQRLSVQRWRDRLASGDIKYATPPLSLPEPVTEEDGSADDTPVGPAGS